MYNYLLLITLLGGIAGQALASDAGTAGAGAGAGAGTTATESTLPAPKKPTFTIKTFPGLDRVPNFNPVTGDCQWFRIGVTTRWPDELNGINTLAHGIDVWFEALPENPTEGTWCITKEGHEKIMLIVKEHIETAEGMRGYFVGRLGCFFSSIHVDPANNNRLMVFDGNHWLTHQGYLMKISL